MNRKKIYVVCIIEDFVRDAQLFNPRDNDELYDTECHDIYSVENEVHWTDFTPSPFVAVVNASTEEEACLIAGAAHRYNPQMLYAFEPKVLDREE